MHKKTLTLLVLSLLVLVFTTGGALARSGDNFGVGASYSVTNNRINLRGRAWLTPVIGLDLKLTLYDLADGFFRQILVEEYFSLYHNDFLEMNFGGGLGLDLGKVTSTMPLFQFSVLAGLDFNIYHNLAVYNQFGATFTPSSELELLLEIGAMYYF